MSQSFAPKRTGVANLPLHYGKAPRWLFDRMTRLSREITTVIIDECGPEEVLRRISDPYWFQAFGCVLGYDWHSSGLTTTVCGAMKESMKGLGKETGLFIAGGKGRTSRKTPEELQSFSSHIAADPARLVYSSRMAAKVDNSVLQDGYQLYHHVFFVTNSGSWAVVQQGMNPGTRYARRYHWLGEKVADFVCEPHNAICAESKAEVLNLTAAECAKARETIAVVAAGEKPAALMDELRRLQTLDLPERHEILLRDIDVKRLEKPLWLAYERKADDFEGLVALEGVGPKTVRALSLISELVYGTPASFRDPARFSFAHGGKDGIPYPVDRKTYDESIALLRRALGKARLDLSEKKVALDRLDRRT